MNTRGGMDSCTVKAKEITDGLLRHLRKEGFVAPTFPEAFSCDNGPEYKAEFEKAVLDHASPLFHAIFAPSSLSIWACST